MDLNSCMSVENSNWVMPGFRCLSRGACRSAMVALALILGLSGCCTPFGPGCHSGNCYDCEGTNQYIPMAPFQDLRHRLTCAGGGCGEVYIGEWISTPPDCPDPCCDDQFVGGASKCAPGCWTLGSLFDWRRFSGRYDDGGCCDSGCDSCGGEEYLGEESYFDAGAVEEPVYQGGSGGCSTCSTRGAGGRTQFAQAPRANGSAQYSQANLSRTSGSAPSSRMASIMTRPPQGQALARPAKLPARAPAAARQTVYSKPVSTVPRTGNSRNRMADQYEEREVQRIRR